MNPLEPFLTRRGLLRGGLSLGAAALFVPGVKESKIGEVAAKFDIILSLTPEG